MASKIPTDRIVALVLMRRTFSAQDHAAAIQKATELNNVVSSVAPSAPVIENAPSGSTISVLILTGIAPPAKVEVDVYDLFKSVDLSAIPSHGIPDISVFEAMVRDSKADTQGGKVFAFVELTQRPVSSSAHP